MPGKTYSGEVIIGGARVLPFRLNVSGKDDSCYKIPRGEEFCRIQKPEDRGIMKDYSVPEALAECYAKDCKPWTMPKLVRYRIISPAENEVWQKYWYTHSFKVTGKEKPGLIRRNGREYSIFVHRPDFLNCPDSIKDAIDAAASEDLNTGAGITPQKEFERLLALKDDRVIVVENDLLNGWPAGDFGIHKPTDFHMEEYGGKIGKVPMLAIHHPMTVPYLGVSEEEAYKVLNEFSEISGRDTIGIWHNDRVPKVGSPLLRLLVADSPIFRCGSGIGDFVSGLDGGGARFFGEWPKDSVI
jgi:hypothetical protein